MPGPRARLWLSFAVVAALFGILAVIGALAVDAQPTAAAIITIAVTFSCLGIVAIAWALFDLWVMIPALNLAREIELASSSRPDHAIDLPEARGLGPLVPAVAGLIEQAQGTGRERQQQINHAVAESSKQKNRLEAILHDASEGIVGCSADGRIALYNPAAVRILGNPPQLGLGRSLYESLSRAPIEHSYDYLVHVRKRDADSSSHGEEFVCASVDGDRLLRCRMSLIVESDHDAGFIITLVNARHDLGARTDDDLRLPEYDHATVHIGAWPTSDLCIEDLVRACNRSLAGEGGGITLELVGQPLWMHGDSYTLTLLLGCMAREIAGATGAHRMDVETRKATNGIEIMLRWTGETVGRDTLHRWAEAHLGGHDGAIKLADVLEHHGSALEPGTDVPPGQAGLRMILPACIRPWSRSSEPIPPRPEFYDVDLFATNPAGDGEWAHRPLRDLPCVVFDTETTGLDPRGRDAIVQIAGIRVVNGRVLSGEIFDCLVNPERSIPKASTDIHGITDAMTAGRPPIAVALRRFHAFVGDAVMIAHNAAFDMAFLRRDATAAAVRFDGPVVDTLLLSVILHDHVAAHGLDDVAKRFGVDVIDRHSALGDSIVTARLFVRMLDVLAQRGLTTLEQIVGASSRAVAVRRQQAARFGVEPRDVR